MGVEDIFNQVLFEKQSTQTRNNFDLNIPLLIFAAVLLFQMLLGEYKELGKSRKF